MQGSLNSPPRERYFDQVLGRNSPCFDNIGFRAGGARAIGADLGNSAIQNVWGVYYRLFCGDALYNPATFSAPIF